MTFTIGREGGELLVGAALPDGDERPGTLRNIRGAAARASIGWSRKFELELP